ncbi:class F sortase [Leifsonia sp. YIM 134122]|uniref:Class F sortase n=1 Tax=Leifsonia stereocauli TaxID=3134136 RepID=A0ABU9W7R4_9MICO
MPTPPATTIAPAPAPAPSSPKPTASVVVPLSGADLDQQYPVAVAPVRIQIPTIGVDMSVQPEGTADTGAMALPPNPADAAWYRYGSWPGHDRGATVIAAHVDSLDYDIGPLARLPEATAGTEVIVTVEDGSERRYEVQTEGMVRKPEVDWPTIFDRGGPPRLVIVTCGGEFDYDRRVYLDNVVVTATPAK